MQTSETIFFAGGCFWGTEHFFKQLRGVSSTTVGYANSLVENPSYKLVCTGTTHAAETVRVEFNPAVVGLPFLIRMYFRTIDPTSLNRQGGDIGTQYRTGIYACDEAQLAVVRRVVAELQAASPEPFVVETGIIENFYPAEDYHQDYLDVNPGGYCHVDPALFRMAREAVDPAPGQ